MIDLQKQHIINKKDCDKMKLVSNVSLLEDFIFMAVFVVMLLVVPLTLKDRVVSVTTTIFAFTPMFMLIFWMFTTRRIVDKN